MRQFIYLFLSFVMSVANGTETKVSGTYAPGLQATRNYVKNPNCAPNTESVTSNATPSGLTSNTSTPLVAGAGTQCRWNPGASSKTLKFDIDTLSPNMANGNCRATFYTGTLTAGDYAAYLEFDSNQVTSNLALTSTVNGQEFNIDYPCGGSAVTTRKLVITSLTSPAAMTIGGVSFGKNLNVGNVAQATLLGKIRISGCTDWSRSSTSFGSQTATSGCSYVTEGLAQAPSTMIPAIKLSSVPAGAIFVVARGSFWKHVSNTNVDAIFRFSDGTNTFGEQVTVSTQSGSGYAHGAGLINGSYTYTAPQSNVTIDIQSKVSGTTLGSAAVISDDGSVNLSGTINGLEIEVYSFPTTSQTVTSNNLSPAFWYGYHDTNCSWANSGNSYDDFTADAACTLNTRQSSSITCTTTGSILPGLACAFQKAGTYEVCATFSSWQDVGGIAGQFRLWDGSSISGASIIDTVYGQISLCGPSVVTGTTGTFTIQSKIASGGINIGNVADIAIEWSVKPASQNSQAQMLTQSVVARDNTLGTTTINTIVSKSANYTATDLEETIAFTATATLSLPAAANNKGKKYEILSSGSSTLVTVDPNASETICGQTTIKLDGADSIRVQSDGTNWVGLSGSCKRVRSVEALVSSGSACSIYSQHDSNWLGTLSAASSLCTIPITSGIFSASPICTASADTTSARFVTVSISSSTQIQVKSWTDAGAAANDPILVTCTGPR